MENVLRWYFKTFKEPRNRFQGIDSAGVCSLEGRFDNPICRTGPPGYIGWWNNRFRGSMNVYKFGLCSGGREGAGRGRQAGDDQGGHQDSHQQVVKTTYFVRCAAFNRMRQNGWENLFLHLFSFDRAEEGLLP